jgi:hypothetical protein
VFFFLARILKVIECFDRALSNNLQLQQLPGANRGMVQQQEHPVPLLRDELYGANEQLAIPSTF